MSWNPPRCPHCSSTSTRFEGAVPFGPPGAYGLYWQCERCRLRVLELCPTGLDDPRPGNCLNCGAAPDADGICPECEADRGAMIARVHALCGSPPRLESLAALAEQGLFRVAFNAVDLLLEQDPDDPAVLEAKAKLLCEVERPGEAVPLLRRALERDVEPRPSAIDLGVALANSGQHEEAVRVYERELERELDPDRRAILLTNIGGCLSRLGRPEQAETYHRRAIELDPEHLGPRWNLFANLYRMQRYEAALEVVEQTMALPWLEPDEVENLSAYRAEILISLRRYHDALEAIELSLRSDPEELNRLATRARILIYLGQHEAARSCVVTMLGIDPDSRLARTLLARLDRRTPWGAKN